MSATLEYAYSQGWKLRVYCRRGRVDHAGKSSRECISSTDIDLVTLIWTRGRTFPLDRLEERLKCPQCGNRHIQVVIEEKRARGLTI